MSRTATIIGPADHGRRMSLDEFDTAEAVEGYLYELSRGVITVVDVPNPRHYRQQVAIRSQLAAYKVAHPGRIYDVASGGDCKILVAGLESERHPDLAVYTDEPSDDPEVWSTYVPLLVVEIVSSGSTHRDYEEKREEYLRFGVKEYWIVDEARDQMLALRRYRGEWRERVVRPGEVYEPRILPGLRFDLAQVFAQGRK
jgi:Uma2 family endonuclease